MGGFNLRFGVQSLAQQVCITPPGPFDEADGRIGDQGGGIGAKLESFAALVEQQSLHAALAAQLRADACQNSVRMIRSTEVRAE
ncbi:MAG: hypothetical protein QM750_10515 [Rubrivivax sp.]